MLAAIPARAGSSYDATVAGPSRPLSSPGNHMAVAAPLAPGMSGAADSVGWVWCDDRSAAEG